VKRFDYKAAKAEGISDDEIAKYLDEKNAAGDSMYIDKGDLAAPDTTPVMTANNNPLAQAASEMYWRGLSLLPGAGGFVGSGIGTIGGAPGRIAGAGIGGGVGEAGREFLSGEPLSPKGIGVAAGLQSVEQGVGEGIVGAAGKIAKPLYHKALSVLPALAERFGMSVEEAAQMVMDKRFRIAASGLAAARKSKVAARATRNSFIDAMQGTVGPATLAKTVIEDSQAAIRGPLTAAQRKATVNLVQDEANQILAARTHGVVKPGLPGTPAQPASKVLNSFGKPAIPATEAIPPPPTRYTYRELEQIKEAAARQARPGYQASRNMTSVASDPLLSEQIASGARNALDKVPGVPEANKELSNAMMAQLAIRKAINKPTGEWLPVRVGPLDVGGIKVPRDRMGDLGLALSDKRVQAFMRHSPRALAEAIHQLIYSDQPDATAQ